MADYNAYSPDDTDAADAYAEQSYAPPLAVLGEWEHRQRPVRALWKRFGSLPKRIPPVRGQ
ncbi:hypothetical protein NKI38_20250 [Mesorhizobium sp. M0621]|uniref:hypothetical protein n=1 Tax=Mesorhizobium sp. M0621 TaxID=2956974 RepID=UPI0033388EF6